MATSAGMKALAARQKALVAKIRANAASSSSSSSSSKSTTTSTNKSSSGSSSKTTTPAPSITTPPVVQKLTETIQPVKPSTPVVSKPSVIPPVIQNIINMMPPSDLKTNLSNVPVAPPKSTGTTPSTGGGKGPTKEPVIAAPPVSPTVTPTDILRGLSEGKNVLQVIREKEPIVTPPKTPSGDSTGGKKDTGLSTSWKSEPITVSGIGTTNINLMQSGGSGVAPISKVGTSGSIPSGIEGKTDTTIKKTIDATLTYYKTVMGNVRDNVSNTNIESIRYSKTDEFKNYLDSSEGKEELKQYGYTGKDKWVIENGKWVVVKRDIDSDTIKAIARRKYIEKLDAEHLKKIDELNKSIEYLPGVLKKSAEKKLSELEKTKPMTLDLQPGIQEAYYDTHSKLSDLANQYSLASEQLKNTYYDPSLEYNITRNGKIETITGEEANRLTQAKSEEYWNKAVEISTEASKYWGTANESFNWDPETKIIRHADSSYDVQFQYAGAENYRMHKKNLEERGFLGQLATAFTPEDFLGIPSAIETARGNYEGGQKLKIKAIANVGEMQKEGVVGFGKWYASSPMGTIGITALTMGTLGAATAVAPKLALAGKVALGGYMVATAPGQIQEGYTQWQEGKYGELGGTATNIGLSFVTGAAAYGAGKTWGTNLLKSGNVPKILQPRVNAYNKLSNLIEKKSFDGGIDKATIQLPSPEKMTTSQLTKWTKFIKSKAGVDYNYITNSKLNSPKIGLPGEYLRSVKITKAGFTSVKPTVGDVLNASLKKAGFTSKDIFGSSKSTIMEAVDKYGKSSIKTSSDIVQSHGSPFDVLTQRIGNIKISKTSKGFTDSKTLGELWQTKGLKSTSPIRGYSLFKEGYVKGKDIPISERTLKTTAKTKKGGDIKTTTETRAQTDTFTGRGDSIWISPKEQWTVSKLLKGQKIKTGERILSDAESRGAVSTEKMVSQKTGTGKYKIQRVYDEKVTLKELIEKGKGKSKKVDPFLTDENVVFLKKEPSLWNKEFLKQQTERPILQRELAYKQIMDDALTTKLNKKLFGASETYYGGRKAPLTETEFSSLSKNQMEVLIKGIGEGKSTVRTSLLKTYQKRFGKEAFNEFLKTEAAEQRLSLTPERATVTKQTFGKTKLFGKSGSGVESIKIFSEPKLFSGLGSSLISTDFASSSITNAPVKPSIEKPVSYQIERVSYESDIVPVTRTGYITDTQQTVITDTSKAVTPKYKQKIDVIQYQPIIQLPEQKIIQETGQQLISEQGQEQQVIQEQQLRQDQLQRQDILTIQKQEQIPIQKQIQKQKQYQKTTGIFVPITPIYGGGDGGLGSGGGGDGRYKQRKYKEREYGIPFVWSVPKELEQKTETKQKAELKKKKNNEDEIDPFIRF